MGGLRDYQEEAITKARASFANGNKRIALCLATGAGKSLIAREIVRLFREKNSTGKIAYFTFRKILINQMKATFDGLDVEMGTLQKHGKTQTELYDLVIIDEVHYANNSKLQNNIKSKFILGLTATPVDENGYALEFDDIIDVIQLEGLIQQGYASPIKVLSTTKVDTTGLKTTAGDFNIKQAYELMSKSQILEDIVKVYKEHAAGLRTIIYAVNIEHCEDLKRQFLFADIECESLHSKKDNQAQIIEDFKSGKINVIINCEVLVTGFDAPDIYCLILASPTKSLVKSTQIYGRATRLNPNDKDKVALIIDCAEVIQNTQHPLQRFDFTKQKKDVGKVCQCGLKMKLSNRTITTLNEYEYIIRSDYYCECGANCTDEKLKLINISLCEGCGMEFKSIAPLAIKRDTKSLAFTLECSCGHIRTFRELEYTKQELKEIELSEAQNSISWSSALIILKSECKKANYHHLYADRIVAHFKAKKIDAKTAIDIIKKTISIKRKISSLMYI